MRYAEIQQEEKDMAIKPQPYIDFKLYLTRPDNGKSARQVALLPTPEVGEAITPVTVPLKRNLHLMRCSGWVLSR